MTSRSEQKLKNGFFLPEIRRICLNFPETEERLNHGMPAFAVKSRTAFVFVQESKKENRASIWFKALPEVQEELVEQDPDRFFRPPYLGPSGWVGLRLDIDLDWEEVAQAAEEAWRLVAPKRAIKELEDSTL